jgi:hypothetical protein
MRNRLLSTGGRKTQAHEELEQQAELWGSGYWSPGWDSVLAVMDGIIQETFFGCGKFRLRG